MCGTASCAAKTRFRQAPFSPARHFPPAAYSQRFAFHFPPSSTCAVRFPQIARPRLAERMCDTVRIGTTRHDSIDQRHDSRPHDVAARPTSTARSHCFPCMARKTPACRATAAPHLALCTFLAATSVASLAQISTEGLGTAGEVASRAAFHGIHNVRLSGVSTRVFNTKRTSFTARLSLSVYRLTC
jgi:hypothetical protein